MVIRQGEIYWIDLPKPKQSEPGFRRPCIVIQNDTFNRSRIKTTIICILTTNLKLAQAPGNVLLNKGDGNLAKDSVVNISQILTVNKADLIPEEKIGKLSTQKIEFIRSRLQVIF